MSANNDDHCSDGEFNAATAHLQDVQSAYYLAWFTPDERRRQVQAWSRSHADRTNGCKQDATKDE